MPGEMSIYEIASRVNGDVNALVTYTPDPEKYQRAEWWADALEAGGKGDCEDYAIAKWHECRIAGIPTDRLRLAVVGVDDPRGDHCVLLIDAEDGQTWMADNRYPDLVPYQDVPYTWVSVLHNGIWRAPA